MRTLSGLLLALALTSGFVSASTNQSPSSGFVLSESRPTNALVFGTNLNVKHALEGDLIERAARLARPTMLRYPGGTWSACWDWRAQTIFPQEHIWDYMEKKAVWLEWIMPAKEMFDLPESKAATSMERFVALADEVGAELSWVVNFNSDTTDSALAMLLAAQAQGFAVDYVELGNEYNGRSFDQRFPTVHDYLAEADPLIAQIREHLPHAKLAYPSNLPMPGIADADQTERLEPWQEREHDWDHTLATRDDGVAIVDHHYFGFPPHRRDQEAELLARFESLSAGDQIVYYLLAPQRMHAGMSSYLDEHLAADKKVWFTEYNMWLHSGPTAELRNSMVNALYLASWKLLLLTDDRVEMAHWHSLVGDTFGFIGQDADGALTASPVVEVFAELAAIARRSTSLQIMEFANPPRVSDPVSPVAAETYPLLQGIHFTGADQDQLVVLNLGASPQTIDLGSLAHANTSGVHLFSEHPAAPERKSLTAAAEQARDIGILQRAAFTAGSIVELPAFSVTILTR